MSKELLLCSRIRWLVVSRYSIIGFITSKLVSYKDRSKTNKERDTCSVRDREWIKDKSNMTAQKGI